MNYFTNFFKYNRTMYAKRPQFFEPFINLRLSQYRNKNLHVLFYSSGVNINLHITDAGHHGIET